MHSESGYRYDLSDHNDKIIFKTGGTFKIGGFPSLNAASL